ncbi:MAG: nucleoside monophosphate kinase [bacterium]
MKKILIFIGPPGSGKGTQAKRVASRYNYGHISTGDLLRALENDEQADSQEKKALADMKAGKLVADWLIYRLAFREINKYLDNGQGVILDGAIRSVEQAKKYQEYFQEKDVANELMAIEVSLTDEECFNRLAMRRICNDCGEIIPWLESTKDLVDCPKCGGQLYTRGDDNQQAIKERIANQGNQANQPILNYYNNMGVLMKIDGSKTINQVEEEIERVLGI